MNGGIIEQALTIAKIAVGANDDFYPTKKTAEEVADFVETLAERLTQLYDCKK